MQPIILMLHYPAMTQESIKTKHKSKKELQIEQHKTDLRRLERDDLIDELVDMHHSGRRLRAASFIGLNMFLDGIIAGNLKGELSEAAAITLIIIKNVGAPIAFFANHISKSRNLNFNLALNVLSERSAGRIRTIPAGDNHSPQVRTAQLLEELRAVNKMSRDRGMLRSIGVSFAGGLSLLSGSRDTTLAASGIGGLLIFSSFLPQSQTSDFNELVRELRERPDLIKTPPVKKSDETKGRMLRAKRRSLAI